MAFWDKLAGTMLSVFKFGGPSGPQIKNTAGVLAARDTTDANYAQFEADLRHLGQAPQTINDLTELNPADPAVDFIPVWDVTAGATRKVKPDNLGITGGGGAPTGAEYIVSAASAGLSAERVLTDNTEISWYFGAGVAEAGIVEVPLAKLPNVPAFSVLCNPEDSSDVVDYVSAAAEGEFLYCDGGQLVWSFMYWANIQFAAIEPATITSNQDDYTPSSFGIASSLRLSSDASRTITSMAPRADGTLLTIENIGSNDIVFQHNSGGTAENRFLLPGAANFTLGPNCGAIFIYDDNLDSTSRWRVLRSVDATGGGGSPVVISPTSFGTDQTDYNPASFSTCTYMRLTTSAAVSIFSLATRTDGTIVTVANIGTFAITLVDEYTTGTTAAQRFALDGNIVIAPESAVDLVYDGTTARWRCVLQPMRTINDMSELIPADADNDFLLVWDSSASATLKVKPNNLGITPLPVAIEPAQITTSQNNYAPAGVDTCTLMRLDSSTLVHVRGLSPRLEGTQIAIQNVGANDIVLPHNSGSATAEWRFATPGDADYTLTPGSGVIVEYNDNSDTTSRWHLLAAEASAGGSGLTHPQVLARTLGA